MGCGMGYGPATAKVCVEKELSAQFFSVVTWNPITKTFCLFLEDLFFP